MRSWTILAAVLCLLLAPVARADGDPASDYLLGQPSFIPPDIHVPSAYAAQLNRVLRDAKARGYVIRVALIGSSYDMGSVSSLYLKPKLYARFLGQELYFIYKGDLLVVMPNGLAVSRGGKALPAEQRLVDRLPAPGNDGAKMAAAATLAVSRLAANAGAVVVVPPLPKTSTSSTTRDRVIIVVAAAVLFALLAAARLILRRRRDAAA